MSDNMTKIYCKQCGAKNDDTIEICPHCGSNMKIQKHKDSSQSIMKFTIFFVLLVVSSIFFMLWLPR